MVLFVLEVEENMGKGENASYQEFIIFPQCFHKPFLVFPCFHRTSFSGL